MVTWLFAAMNIAPPESIISLPVFLPFRRTSDLMVMALLESIKKMRTALFPLISTRPSNPEASMVKPLVMFMVEARVMV